MFQIILLELFQLPICTCAPAVSNIKNKSDGNSRCVCLIIKFPATDPTCNIKCHQWFVFILHC